MKTSVLNKLSFLTPIAAVVMLTACSQQPINIQGSDQNLVTKQVTEASNVVIFPDDNPSIPDGKIVWDKQNCASCHGEAGKGISGKTTVDLSNEVLVHKQKPLELYYFLTYGKPMIDSQGFAPQTMNSQVMHPAMKDLMSRREIWDLVFYTRSIAVPPLSDKEIDSMDIVFAGNCAVCHGKRGFADGPLTKGAILEPVPANFHQFNRFYDRTDDVLWDHIANGIKWEGMPNFLNKVDRPKNVKFDEAYIKKLVQFVRHFHSSNQATVSVGLAPQAATETPAGKSN